MKKWMMLGLVILAAGSALAAVKVFRTRGAKTIDVCLSETGGGCEYSTLNAACAAVTATATHPVTFHVHAGVYAATNTMCSGQDHVSFIGDGMGATILQASNNSFGSDFTHQDCTSFPQACKGAINLGTSTNIEIAGMTLKGTRGIFHAGNNVGGGYIYIHDTEFIDTTVVGDEDCIQWDGLVNGSILNIRNNRCVSSADGYTMLDVQGDATQYHSSGNLIMSNTANFPVRAVGILMAGIPCVFESNGDQIRYIGKQPDNSASAVYGFDFDQPRTAGKTCSSNAIANITAPTIYVESTATSGGPQARGIDVSSLATNLATVNIVGASVQAVSHDVAVGIAYGINNANSATTINVVGGRYRSSGGLAASTKDIASQTNCPINIYQSTDWATRAGNETIVPMPGLNVNGFGTTGLTVTDSDPGADLVLQNTDGANNEASPYQKFISSSLSPENFYINESNAGTLTFYDGSFNPRMTLTQAGALRVTGGDFTLDKADGVILLGTGANNDNLEINFAAANAAHFYWINTAKRMNMTGVTVLRLTPLATAPATCVIGDYYVDTSGAYCTCSAVNTWTNTNGVGSCV
jgi:Pectinesterase